jgi:phospholipid/cholesterol/gamma-HCH transport system ATP-binding protein
MDDAAHVRLRGVRMAFGGRRVFDDLSCGFARGRVSVVLGGSGSGKSTMLKLIAGLVRPVAGTVVVDGDDVSRLGERELTRVRRKLGMMFQGGALLDSLSVFDNLAFPLREHRMAGAAGVGERVHRRLEDVGLRDVDALLPGQLSGGMTKRVALARALMMDPVILLCDEPFSGLDPISQRRVEDLLVRVNRERGITMVVVSHHIPSTVRMADHVVLLLPDRAVEGAPGALLDSGDPLVRAFMREEDVAGAAAGGAGA